MPGKLHNIFVKLCTLLACCHSILHQYIGCWQREKHLFTCHHARRSLTTLAHPASILAALIKTTTLCQTESEWYRVTDTCPENNRPVMLSEQYIIGQTEYMYPSAWKTQLQHNLTFYKSFIKSHDSPKK